MFTFRSLLRLPFARNLLKPLAFTFSTDGKSQDPNQAEKKVEEEEEPKPKEEAKDKTNEETKAKEPLKAKEGFKIELLKSRTFDELIEINTDPALREAERRIATIQEENKTRQSKIVDIKKEIEMLDQASKDSRAKRSKLSESLAQVTSSVEQSKKRAKRQVEDTNRYAVTKIAKELLEVADCLASCKKFVNEELIKHPEDEFCLQILNCQEAMKDLLKKHEIEQFDPMGKPYNPNMQESLLQIPCMPGFEPNNVGIVMRTGYTINGRLLRSARVGIFV